MNTIKMKKILFIIFITLFSGCWETSDGVRVGIPTKLTKEGLFWKTWGGEVIMGGMREKNIPSDYGVQTTSVPNIWQFGLDYSKKHEECIDELIGQIQQAIEKNRPIKFYYTKELIVAPWRTSENYMVYRIEEL